MTREISKAYLLYFPLPPRYGEYIERLLSFYNGDEARYLMYEGFTPDETMVNEITAALYLDAPKLDIPELEELYESILYFLNDLGIRVEYIVAIIVDKGMLEIYYDETDNL